VTETVPIAFVTHPITSIARVSQFPATVAYLTAPQSLVGGSAHNLPASLIGTPFRTAFTSNPAPLRTAAFTTPVGLTFARLLTPVVRAALAADIYPALSIPAAAFGDVATASSLLLTGPFLAALISRAARLRPTPTALFIKPPASVPLNLSLNPVSLALLYWRLRPRNLPCPFDTLRAVRPL